ncbi:MAG: class I SAM-dependent methyltransferase [Bacteroidetes bacterium]|nr:class I SAM-dependent methyltransferase [Bacteroidota bacterium]
MEENLCRMCGSKLLSDMGIVKNFPFFACDECEFIFSPKIDSSEMAKRYKSGYHGISEGAPSKGWPSSVFILLEPVFNIAGKNNGFSILDFGAGQSILPEALRKLGNDVTEIDVAPIKNPHPSRITGDITKLKLSPEIFDITYSFQVFEHLAEPGLVLNELLRLTKPGGFILIHTDMETPERAEGFENWWYVLPPDHCSFYRHRTFELFVQKSADFIPYKEPKAVLIQKNTNKQNFA